jgi:aspartate kinase
MTFTVARSELFTAEEALKKTPLLKDAEIRTDGQVAKVSVIGIGMNSHVGVAKTMFQTLADKGINILAIGSSEIKISVLIKEDYVELAVRALHTAFDLESDSPSSS